MLAELEIEPEQHLMLRALGQLLSSDLEVMVIYSDGSTRLNILNLAVDGILTSM